MPADNKIGLKQLKDAKRSFPLYPPTVASNPAAGRPGAFNLHP
jgi:hypothetical protein